MKKVFDVVKSTDGYEFDVYHVLNLSLNLVVSDFGERLQVIFNGVPDGVFFKFDWLEAKKC